MIKLRCSLTAGERDTFIHSDNGATRTILKRDHAIMVEDFLPVDGNVSGSTPGTLVKIVGKGYITFLVTDWKVSWLILPHQSCQSARLAAHRTLWNED